MVSGCVRDARRALGGQNARTLAIIHRAALSRFQVHPENRVIGFVLLPIRPAELGKTTNTTFTTSNNLRAVARIALLLQGKQQNTTLRQDITPGEISRKCVQGEALFIVVSIAASLMSAWASKRRCPREALYLVVKVVQVVFHVSTLHHSIFRKNLFFVDPMFRGI